jgi:fibronectin type 3 domain-containing protein
MRLLNGTLSGYRITRQSANQKQAVVLQNNYPTVFNGYLDSTAVAGEQYQYNVECLAGNSSAMASIDSAMPYVGYTAPSGLTGFNAANGISLLWGKVYDKRVKQFAIYRYTRDSDAQLVAKVPSTDLKFTDTRAAKGQTWYYYIRSVSDANQVSAKSNEVYVEY